ncbi:MAG: hypothetical protein AAF664_02595 [Planctomycetota bacterium]
MSASPTLLELLLLFAYGIIILVRACKENSISIWMNPSASCLTGPGTDSRNVTGLQIRKKDLVDRIARIAFTLEDRSTAGRVKIAFAAANTFEGQLMSVFIERALIRWKRLFGWGTG